MFNSFVLFFVRQTIGNVFFEGCISCHLELHTVSGIVIFDDFNNALFFKKPITIVINTGVKQSGNLQIALCFKQFIILDCLWNATGSKNRMKLAVVA